jgi:ABC-type uncharacterized transport system substrate-binding protein
LDFGFGISDWAKEKTMHKGKAIFVLVAAIFGSVCLAEAQQTRNLPRIGWLWYGSSPSGSLPTLETAIMDGLRELGYVDGKNIILEHRFAEGRPERLPELANDLVRQNVDVIIGIGGDIAAVAKTATATIPIVVGTSDDPVRSSLIASLARPGGNITGVTFISNELAGKRLELLKEINPKLTRAGVLWNPAHFDNEFKEIQTIAHVLGIKLQSLKVQRPEEFEEAFASVAKYHAQGLVVVPSRLTSLRRDEISGFAKKVRIPMISGWKEFSEAGGLASYGPNREVTARRVAYDVDKILKGAKPADLPVERPTMFEFVINLKTAKQIGLTIPQSVLFRADKVIK